MFVSVMRASNDAALLLAVPSPKCLVWFPIAQVRWEITFFPSKSRKKKFYGCTGGLGVDSFEGALMMTATAKR